MDYSWLSNYEYYEWLIRQEFRMIFDSVLQEEFGEEYEKEIKKELLNCISNIYSALTNDSKNEFVKVLFTEIGNYRLKNFSEFNEEEKRVISEVYSVFEQFDEVLKIVTELRIR
jgi:hypothetical protein